MKKPKKYHHVILHLTKPDEKEVKVHLLNVNRTIKRSNLSEELKQHYRNLLRNCLMTNRKFFKDIRAAKKSMMIQEKLLEERWRLHADALAKIRAYIVTNPNLNAITENADEASGE